MRHTKIISTMGPSVDSYDKIVALIEAGIHVARLNFSHGTHESHLKMIKLIKKAREALKKPLAIMLDTKGPEVRIGSFSEGKKEVFKGMRLFLVKEASSEDEIPIHPFEVLDSLQKGMKVLFDDGYIQAKVIDKKNQTVEIEILNSGVIKAGKSAGFPEAKFSLEALTEQDKEDLIFGCKNGIDMIAASFIRTKEQLLSIKQFLSEQGAEDIPIIAKIEDQMGVDHFDEILDAADGIMIARGDLGVLVDLSLLPRLQKMMIRKCQKQAKPVIIATQMLESMILNPRPTRAEVSDVANAVYESASAVMLSGETASGNYPIETVEQMRNIIQATEEDFAYEAFFERQEKNFSDSVSYGVALAAVKTANSTQAKAIFVYTSSGYTARLLSSLRPRKPILALTSHEKTYHQLALSWGVMPLLVERCRDSEEAFWMMSDYAQKKKLVGFGDLIVVVAGLPFGRRGSTNMMRIESIGPVLVRGLGVYGKKVSGIVKILFSYHDIEDEDDCKGKILALVRSDKSYEPLFKHAKGIILQNAKGDVESEKIALTLCKKHEVPLIVQADNAMTLLQTDEEVEMDGQTGLICSD